jgi:flagellar FliL protein
MAADATTAVMDKPEADAEDGEAKTVKLGIVKRLIGKIRGLNKFVLIGISAGLLLTIGGAGYFMMMGGHKEDAVKAAPKVVFYDLPEMTVNLSASPERPQYLRVKITLEAEDAKIVDAIKPVMPRVVDAFQVHLRELRVTDLEGSAGLFRLREELTRRVNLAIAPNRIRAVLFREIVVQ